MYRPILFFSLAFLLFFKTQSWSQQVQLSIELDGQTYYEGESVYLVVSLTNTGTTPYAYELFYLSGRALKLVVKNAVGKIIPYQGDFAEFIGPPRKFELKPSCTDQELINVSLKFPSITDRKRDFTDYPFLSMMKPDRYTVQATYQNDRDTMVSNTLTFDVVSPPPAEREAFDELRGIFRDVLSRKITQQAADTLNGFISRHQASAYTPLAYSYLSGSYRALNNLSKANDTRLQIIKGYPNRGYALEAIENIKISPPEKEKLCRSVNAAQQSGLLKRFTTSLLNRLDANKKYKN